MIAFYGYDGFLYSIGYLAGWVVALFVIAEPLKRLGKFTFADALDSQLQLAAASSWPPAISTLAVSMFYLIPQMVGAGVLVQPLLGLPHWAGVVLVGAVVILIVVTAGMVSTTWVQFIKGSLLVVFSTVLTVLILAPRLSRRRRPCQRNANRSSNSADGQMLVNGLPQGTGRTKRDLRPVGIISRLPGGVDEDRPARPARVLQHACSRAKSCLWPARRRKAPTARPRRRSRPSRRPAARFCGPASSPTFKGIRSDKLIDKLNFLSLMLALFCGTASLPHILIRYYTVKDEAAARKSTVVGIASIGFFYVLTLYLGLGAMTSGALDVDRQQHGRAAAGPQLQRAAVRDHLGDRVHDGARHGQRPDPGRQPARWRTTCWTASGAVQLTDHEQGPRRQDRGGRRRRRRDRAGHPVRGAERQLPRRLGVQRRRVGQPAGAGDAAVLDAARRSRASSPPIIVGMVSSLAWILLSGDTFEEVYGLPAESAPVPFSQPGIVTIPLGFATLVVVSLIDGRQRFQQEASLRVTSSSSRLTAPLLLCHALAATGR